MSMLVLDKHDTNQYDSLPKGWAYFAIHGKEGILYSGYTAKLSLRMQVLESKANDNALYAEMLHQATKLEYTLHSTALSALMHFKASLFDALPLYQHRLNSWDSYAYLALDAHRMPFISITEHTNDDWLYLGPFRSRFFLSDVIDIYTRILKLPACESQSYPCEKHPQDRCRGWCLNLLKQKPISEEYSLDKLDSLLKEAFVHPENGILEMVQKTRDDYSNNLEFHKAGLLDDEIELLEKYRDWLVFLYNAKNIDFENEVLSVQKGKITRFIYQDREYNFPSDSTSYRKNEALALNMETVDESRIIYDYLRKREQ